MMALPKAEGLMIMGYMILKGPFQPQTVSFYTTSTRFHPGKDIPRCNTIKLLVLKKQSKNPTHTVTFLTFKFPEGNKV